MKLHLGVIEIPYVRKPSARRGNKVTAGTVTTGDVAGWLETKYAIMETFFDVKKDKIANEFAESVAGAMETTLMGGPIGAPLSAACSEIEKMFRSFISTREAERVGIPGTPTQAALDGVNNRLKKRSGPRRPSFRDTGAYMNSFKAWVD